MQSVEKLLGPVEEFHLVLQELRCKAEAAVTHNKPDRWDYYVEMAERLTEWFAGVDANDGGYAAAALALSQKAEAECPLLARREAVRLWALGVYARRILRAWGVGTGTQPSLEWFRRRAASVNARFRNSRQTDDAGRKLAFSERGAEGRRRSSVAVGWPWVASFQEALISALL